MAKGGSKAGWRAVLGATALMALAACGGAESGDAEGDAAAPEASADAAPADAAGGGSGDLAGYVGKYPFDEVDGVTWNDHPLVTAGVAKTVTDDAVREAMQMDGPSAPIAMYQGKVGAWSCQQHNCGDHQWTVLVDPQTGATDVCYHNAEQSGDQSRWFLADGKEETRAGNCSVV